MTSTTARADRTDLPAPAPAGGPPLHLRAAGVSLVLDCSGPLLPRVLHWGADLFDRSVEELADLAVAATPQAVSNNVDEVVPVLRKRGLFRHEYAGRTLRGHLGLAVPERFGVSV